MGISYRSLWIVLIGLCCLANANACLWDSDTLASETKAFPGLVDVITGRFERNPPLYYEMRLSRVAQEIEKNPDNLALYDDAGVACDRLNSGTEAMHWMDRKKVQLDARPDSAEAKEHMYRYYANLGTFKAHEWFRRGADIAHPQLMEEGRDLIKKAIEINPDAHFGREIYQLKFMEWVLAGPVDKSDSRLPDFLNLVRRGEPGSLSAEELDKASKGIQGLIVLGNAWESLDCFHALSGVHSLLDNNYIRQLAVKRSLELSDAGKLSVVYTELSGVQLDSAIASHRFARQAAHDDVKYETLRENAKEWDRHRTEFMLKQLQTGKHPDTDKEFWSGYREIKPVSLNPFLNPRIFKRYLNPQFILSAIAVTFIFGCLAYKIVTRKKMHGT